LDEVLRIIFWGFILI